MIRNYLKIAFRNLKRHKLFSFINIFGLALSMSICLLVLIHLKDQLSYDDFHPHPGRTYRIISELSNKEGNTFRLASSPLPLAVTLANNYDFIEHTTRIYTIASSKAAANKKEINTSQAFTDPSFLTVFGFTLKDGNEQTALNEPNSIVLSAGTAQKFFGTANALGQLMELPQLGSFTVTGVLNQPASHSHLECDAYLSMSSVAALEKSGKLSPLLDQWNMSVSAYTYVLLKENISSRQLDKAVAYETGKLRQLSQSRLNGKENFAFEVQPFNKIILGEELQRNLGNTGSRQKIWAEILAGLVILISACFNYTNLSIARSLSRGKEIGIRKVAGAVRYQLFAQFITEAIVVALIALCFAGLLLQLIITYAPFINEIGIYSNTIDVTLLSWFILFAVFAGFIAGALPAWALSSFKTVQVLKNLASIKLFGGNNFRKVLLIAQFVLALVITIFTTIASKQFTYLSTADPGYNRDNILLLPLQDADQTLLTANINRLQGVEKIAATSVAFGANTYTTDMVKPAAGKEAVKMNTYDVDSGFAGAMELQFAAGQNFTNTSSEAKEQFAITNETAIHALGFKNAADAVGKMIWLNDSVPVQLTGVLKDFYYQSMAVPVMPLLLRNRPAQFNLLLVKTSSTDKKLLGKIEAAWKTAQSAMPFKSSWLRDDIYDRQSAWGTVSMLGFLAFMSITIACLGLLGMVIYNAETRRKEIGIRKVMGASVATIVGLLSKSFLKLVLIAGAIAIPIGYLCGFFFLNIFANRVSIGVGTLLVSLLGILLIVMITIGSQVFKAAIANPVKSLRTE
jgi:putative ABC transport system permease protein